MIYKLQSGKTLPSIQHIQQLQRKEGKRNEPKEDAWNKEKKRIQKETDKIKQENSWIGKTANVLHHVGVGATGLGLLGSFIAAPAATALGLIGGIAGEQAVNKATKKVSDFLTNEKGKTWNEYAEQLGLSPTLAAFTNPGAFIGGTAGAKASQYRPKPGYLGMNGTPLERKSTPIDQLFNFERWFGQRNPKYVTEQDKKILTEHLPEYKRIQEKALDEGTYMHTSKDFPGSKVNENGEYIFQGDEGSWIQSKSNDFQKKFGDKTLKIGYKGGTDQKIEGVTNTHVPETFPDQDNGVFFTGVQDYANMYNSGKPAPAYWLGFRKPYDMLNGSRKPFLLEDNNVKFMRSVEAYPSFKGEFPDQPINIIHKVWNSDFINNPEIMKLLTSNPHTLNKEQQLLRLKLLHQIRSGQHRKVRDGFIDNLNRNIESGKWRPRAGNYYDGYIGRDHAFGYGEYNGVVKDDMWPFGSFPETYVIKHPEQASSIIGNNGAFQGPAYTRKKGGKLWQKHMIQKTS